VVVVVGCSFLVRVLVIVVDIDDLDGDLMMLLWVEVVCEV